MTPEPKATADFYKVCNCKHPKQKRDVTCPIHGKPPQSVTTTASSKPTAQETIASVKDMAKRLAAIKIIPGNTYSVDVLEKIALARAIVVLMKRIEELELQAKCGNVSYEEAMNMKKDCCVMWEALKSARKELDHVQDESEAVIAVCNSIDEKLSQVSQSYSKSE